MRGNPVYVGWAQGTIETGRAPGRPRGRQSSCQLNPARAHRIGFRALVRGERGQRRRVGAANVGVPSNPSTSAGRKARSRQGEVRAPAHVGAGGGSIPEQQIPQSSAAGDGAPAAATTFGSWRTRSRSANETPWNYPARPGASLLPIAGGARRRRCAGTEPHPRRAPAQSYRYRISRLTRSARVEARETVDRAAPCPLAARTPTWAPRAQSADSKRVRVRDRTPARRAGGPKSPC